MDFKKSLFFILILVYSSILTAELRDPTKPTFYSSAAITETQQPDRLTLSSIWSSGTTRRVIINGVVAKQGDIILSDIKIIKIYSNAVTISQNGMIKKLSLLKKSFKTKQD